MWQKKQNESEDKVDGKKSIIVISTLFIVLFLMMILYLIDFMYKDSLEVINNTYNPRQDILAKDNIRGNILSADGEILARTVVDSEGVETREYPYDNLFAHVVGYSTNGRMGVEALANYYLLNSHESVQTKLKNDLDGKKNQGDSVVTTLDSELQAVAEEALGVYDGAIIVMNPKTGDILAMVSKPDFNPNEIQDIWDDLLADTDSTVLLNRASQGLYPPGSTFKILTALAFIRENPKTYLDYSFDCNGKYVLDDDTIRCYEGTKHGTVNLAGSFAHSCNSSFANIGISLDRNKFSEVLDSMLFNQKLPVSFLSATSTVNVSEGVSDGLMLQTAIGQGATQVTPLHMAMITSAIANNGTMVVPDFLDMVTASDGSLVKTFENETVGTVLSETESDVLTDMMRQVVEDGTGHRLQGTDYMPAGKTGSAEFDVKKGYSHAWFTGFAPYNDPEIVVTVVIEGAGSGGDYAVPIAKRIFDSYFGEE